METIKVPDRLNCSNNAFQLLEKIDNANYMGLDKGMITRSEVFLFAMSLGVESKTKNEITSTHQGGLILEKSIDSKTRASIYSQYIISLKEPSNELDEILKKDKVFKLAEQYANAGFEMIAYYFENKEPEELVIDLFLELDSQYEKINQGRTNGQ